MFFGRIIGWFFLFVSFLTVSAEAVAALGTGEYIGIATSDVLTIITGISPQTPETFAGQILLWPAWATMGAIGLVLVFSCRKKKLRTAFSK